MVGRFIGAGLLRKIKTGYLLALCAICTSLLVVISMLTSGHIAMWSILAVGLFKSWRFAPRRDTNIRQARAQASGP
jgi:FHS family L-fucose permease-like MFS transporter